MMSSSPSRPAPQGATSDPRFQPKVGEPLAARITATDYNPTSGFDSAPIIPLTDWLLAAADARAIRPVTPGSTDYAEWEVDTDHGTILATPGDWIALGFGGRLMVLREHCSALALAQGAAPAGGANLEEKP